MPLYVDPEISKTLQALAAAPARPQPPVGDALTRRANTDQFFTAMRAASPAFADVERTDFHATTSDGYALPLRWFRKKEGTAVTGEPAAKARPGSAFVYSHGGGMMAGSIDLHDRIVASLVSASGVPMLSVDYRLAPEFPAPIPVTDVYAGLCWLHDHAAELGVDTARIGIMGDSAGGGISASLAHYAKLQGGPAIQKQILVYPMLDDRTIEPVDPELAKVLIWSRDDNETGWSALLGAKRGTDAVDVTMAAGRATVDEARGLPPAYIDIGDLDLFLQEDISYALTLARAGVSCELHVIPGAPHAFEFLGPEADIVKLCMAARVRQLQSI